MTDKPTSKLKAVIIKGSGTEHTQIIQYVEYSGGDEIIAPEETEIEVGELIYIQNTKLQVIGRVTEAGKKHIRVRRV